MREESPPSVIVAAPVENRERHPVYPVENQLKANTEFSVLLDNRRKNKSNNNNKHCIEKNIFLKKIRPKMLTFEEVSRSLQVDPVSRTPYSDATQVIIIIDRFFVCIYLIILH